MGITVELPREEYEELVSKAKMFDKYIESEELTQSELSEIKKAMKGPFLTKAQFLKRHPELN